MTSNGGQLTGGGGMTSVIHDGSLTGSGTTAAQLSFSGTVPDLNIVNNSSGSVGPELDWQGFSGRWFVGVDVANSPTSRDFVLTGLRQDYSFPDGATTSGSPTLTSASGGGFTSALVGASISGAGIPNGTTISAVGGTTSLTMSANATATATGVRVTIVTGSSQDLLYWAHRGARSPTCGIGVTPPDGTARLQVGASASEPAMGTVRIGVGASQTGKALTIHDSSPVDRLWVDKDFYLSGANASVSAAIAIQADATNHRPLALTDNDKASVYGFSYPGANALRFSYFTGAKDIFQAGSDGSLFFYENATFQKIPTFQSAIKGSGARAAAPSTGTHVAGEIVFNADPIAGGKIGWVCVTGGTPGTWKAWGVIDA